MFFPRLRNQAKWAFVFLILVFAGGFVFLGVGSGGLDLGQLIRDAFGNKGPSTGSVSKARKEVEEHPLSAAARRKYADVLERKGQTDDAIAAWAQYAKLRPKDVDALRRLGRLELGQADSYFQQAQLAALAQQEAGANSPFRPSTTGKFGQALGQDPISTALSTRASSQLQETSAKYQTAATQAIKTFQQLVKLTPNDQQAFFSLAQAADTLHQTAVAVRAYKKLLTFDLDSSTKAQIRERIRTLRGSGG
jgi:tetratricopeptide (TPR) repeat protein